MDLTPYVTSLRRDLALAAETGGPEAQALAERLSASLESAARLALLDALSAAADEITRDLAPGSVEVRLRGRDPGFVVTPPPADLELTDAEGSAGFPGPGPRAAPGQPTPPDSEEGGTSRITLRLPEHLKPRIEEAAGRAGLSVNAWLVRAVTAALEPEDRRLRPERRSSQLGQRYTGWVR